MTTVAHTPLIKARRRDLDGFEVGRVLPAPQHRMIGPFIFFDHMGPVKLPANIPRTTDVRPHPHIGLATITYLFAGEIVHRDSVGFEQVIRPGEVNWMTAGRGISHSERFDSMRESGGWLNGIQAWIALPHEHEEVEPSFVHFDADELPLIEMSGAHIRLIAGSAFGGMSPVRTYSPLVYAHIEMSANSKIEIPATYSERAIYVVDGRINVNAQPCAPGEMSVLKSGTEAVVIGVEKSRLMLLGGESIGPRHIWWNFVSSRSERIEQAKAEWRDGRFRLPVGDASEFIPLPQEPRPAEPMS